MSNPLVGLSASQVRAAEVLMKMQAQAAATAQKTLLVRAMVILLSVMILATLIAGFVYKNLMLAGMFTAVDATLGFGYRAMSVHFFPPPEDSKSASTSSST